MSEILKKLEDYLPHRHFIYPTGYEHCIVGLCTDTGICVLDANKIINHLIEIDEMSHEDAVEHFHYNIEGSKGDGFPIYIHTEPL